MQGSFFDETEFFRAIQESGARSLLIGRRAMIAYGVPVLTADYDYWIHVDDIAVFNEAAAQVGLLPTRSPADARQVGRYVVENGEHVDVMVARAVPTVDGQRVSFDDLWTRRERLDVAGVGVFVPCIEDLILTKRFAGRARDAEDIRLLKVLASGES